MPAFVTGLFALLASASSFPASLASDIPYTADDSTCVLFNQAHLQQLLFVSNRSVEMSSNFRIVTEFRTDYSPSKVTKYESKRTGMTAVVVDREGPKVHGFFAFATEIFDDSGAPHTLEHLCFMGSRSYPYKGILDKLATRSVLLWPCKHQ